MSDVVNQQIGDKSTEKPQSATELLWVFILYAFTRSIKSSSSYLQPFNRYLDKLSSTSIPDTSNKETNSFYKTPYTKLNEAYHLRVQPKAITAQMLSYVFFVLTSSLIGFDIIIWLDIFCQIINVLLVALLYFNVTREILTSQIASIVYGIATATGNVFHQYAYCVFDKSMFHKVSGATRSATMAGHFLGGGIGIAASFFMKEDSTFVNLYEQTIAKNGEASFERVQADMYIRFVRIIMGLLISTAVCMLLTLAVSFRFPKLSKEAKAKSKKSVGQVLKSVVHATNQFKNPSVLFWGVSWCLSFMSMIFCKTWAISHFNTQQTRLNAPVLSSYADVAAYAAGAVGSLVPKKCLSVVGYGTTVTIQLFVSLLAAAASVCLSVPWGNMYFFYAAHCAFTFLVYFSMAFQSGELARCVAPDQSKLVFYLLTFSVFLTQEALNKTIFDGIGHATSIPPIKRYVYMAGFMVMNFLLIFVGFSGTSRGEQMKPAESKKDLEKAAEKEQEAVHSKKE